MRLSRGGGLTVEGMRRIMPAMSTPADNEWLSTEEACRLLKVSRATLWRRLAAGELDGVRQYRPSPRKLYFHRGDLLLWMDAHTRRPDS